MRSGKSPTAWVTALMLLWLMAGTNSATLAIRLMGTSSTALYTQEVAKAGSEDEFENRTRLYERLQFELRHVGCAKLSFNGFLTARNDITNESLSDTKTRIYRGYFRYLHSPGNRDALRIDTRIGRQWVTSGVGSGTIDGASVRLDRSRWGGLTLFAGTLGIENRDQSRIENPDESMRYGAELRLRPSFREGAEPEIAASFADTKRDSQDVSRRMGLRASLLVRRQLRLWSQVRHDFHLDETFDTAAGVDFTKPHSRFHAWGEFHRRTPALEATSYYRKFESATKPITQLRAGIGFGVGGPYSLGFDFSRTDFKEETTFGVVNDTTRVSRSDVDRAKAFRLFLQRGAIRVGWTFQSGFGGDRTRFLLSASHDFGTRLSCDVNVGIDRYDYGPSDFEDNTARTGLLSATYRPWPHTKVTAQVEGLDNRDLERDLRLLLRVDRKFRFER